MDDGEELATYFAVVLSCIAFAVFGSAWLRRGGSDNARDPELNLTEQQFKNISRYYVAIVLRS